MEQDINGIFKIIMLIGGLAFIFFNSKSLFGDYKKYLELDYKGLVQQFHSPLNSSVTSGYIDKNNFRRLQMDVYPSFLVLSFLNMATVVKYEDVIELSKDFNIQGYSLKANGNGREFKILLYKKEFELIQSLMGKKENLADKHQA